MISIVVPVYNQAEYLPDCLDSIAKQILVPYKVVIVDDGSTDGSGEIADKYADEYNWTVVHQVNKGLSSARNTGIMNCSSDYILFIDSDDTLEEWAVATIEDAIERHNFDIIAPSLKCFGLNNDEVILMENPQLKDFRIGNRIGSCVCIRRICLLNVGGYSSKMIHGYEDLHLIINLLTNGLKIMTLPEVLWFYRVKENSMASTAKNHHEELLTQINNDFPEANLNF